MESDMNNARNRAAFARSVMSPRVLVVDGDAMTLKALIGMLAQRGYEVETASTGQQASAMLRDGLFDVMILDPDVPDAMYSPPLEQALDGCRDLLLVVLSKDYSLASAVTAARFRAAEFLLKDPDPEITAESVGAALARHARPLRERLLLRVLEEALDVLHAAGPGQPTAEPIAPRHILHVPPLWLNQRERVVLIDEDFEHAQHLTPGETEVLLALMQHPGQVLTMGELGRALTGVPVEEHSVRSAVTHLIHRLRSKLEQDPAHPHLIRTIRGVGYLYQPKGHAGGGDVIAEMETTNAVTGSPA